MIHCKSWKNIWYKFQTFMLKMTEDTVKWKKSHFGQRAKFAVFSCFVKTVALTLKLSFLFNFYGSGIKFDIHLLPYVEINFCKYEWYSLFSFDFIAKTEGPVLFETACISCLNWSKIYQNPLMTVEVMNIYVFFIRTRKFRPKPSCS